MAGLGTEQLTVLTGDRMESRSRFPGGLGGLTAKTVRKQ